MREEVALVILVVALVVSATVAIVSVVHDDPTPKPAIGKAVCVKTTVRPDGSVHTETCVP